MTYDVAIVGAGVIGSALFRELGKFNLKTVLIEKENDVALGSSRANSAIVHAGYDPPNGTMLARFNVEGNRLYPKLCADLSVPFRQNGSLIVALCEEDLVHLRELYENGVKNGVDALEIVGPEAVRQMEPNLQPTICGALVAPTGGIVGSYELTTALAESGVINGGEVLLNSEVTRIEKFNKDGEKLNDLTRKGLFRLTFSNGRHVDARFIVNAAGIYSDSVQQLIGKPRFSVTPRKGEYYILDKRQGALVDRTIFMCPSKLGKGVLISPTVHGNLLVGPDAQDGDDKSDFSTTQQGLAFVRKTSALLSDKVDFRDSIRNFAGLRALPSGKDFIIELDPDVDGLLNLAGIKSPGLTSAPAIAKHSVELLANAGLDLIENPRFNPYRRQTRFAEMSDAEKTELVRKDSSFGRIICRCEQITEGEIVEAIRRPLGAKTVDGVKRRCRPGSGRCQGGFCGPRVLEILARELATSREGLLKDKNGSYILAGKTKETE
ncbi:MAG: NAD(P)/FAD-dependent oxidoreductase [Thermoguttaceae bacterium]|nr:NAD(P)/FAD-dependent oxidoreductase [Thermoguttaceae bacterium]